MSFHRTTESVIFRQPVLLLRWNNVRKMTVRGMAHSRQLARSQANAIQPIRASPFTLAAAGGVLSAAILAFSQTSDCESSSIVMSKFFGGDGGSPSANDGGKSNGKDGNNSDDPIDKLINQLADNLGTISFGGAVGFCSGYAVKQVGKVAAVSIGVLFIAAQVASKSGYVDINWNKVERDVVKYIDSTGDGKITKTDLQTWYKKFMAILKQNVPSSSGFACGFVLGLTCA